nr:zinc finger, CCHC-type [Tanacetum cinerariifolium]
ENGIARQLTAPYSPQQNGVVERRNRTVLSTTRSIMKAMKLPLTFWVEAVRHAIYILNRIPTKALVDKTPYEALYNRKSNLEKLRIFGCTAYAKITIPHLKKLDDRSIPLVYLGVEEGSKACRLYDPIAKKKHVSRDVKFMETKPWDWNKDGEDTSTQDVFWASFVVEGVDNENTSPINTEINDNIDDTYQEPDLINDPNSKRLGHLNFDDINKMTRKGLVEGIPRINHAGQICDACLLGKHSRTPFLNQAKFRSKNPLDLVYGDLCGPISPATHSGKKLIFLLVDDCTRFIWAYFLTLKDQEHSTFKEFRQKIEMEMRMKVRMLRTDRGVERRNRTILSTTRSMMKAMKLPLNFWAEVVRQAIYILNRVPTRALEDKTPYEALYNRKPNLENLRIFRCTAYAKITIPHLKKLDDRSIPMIYLRVEEGSKACRLYDPITKKKHVSRDVKFMETKPWDWNKGEEDTSTQDTFWTSFVVEGVDNENATPVNIEINDNIDNPYQEQDPINDPNSPITPSTYTYNPHSKEEEEATTSSMKNSRNIFDHVPVREEEPRNYKEASTNKKWIEAMEIELDSINKNNTWTLTTLPPDQKAIGLKWVFKTKRDAKGNIIKYKARLVEKGYEEVYVTQPEGFIQQGNSGKVYKLTKALYGLRQAPRAWNVKLDQTLKSLDFKKCNLEQAVYTKRSKTSTLIVGVYKLHRQEERSQSSYINKILKETSMTDSNDTKIPMDPGTKLVKAEDGNSVDATYYRSLIGSLRYLLHTRPDLSYSVGLLSRFLQDPKDHHLKAVKQVIRYIKGTKEHDIIYKKEGGCKITGYSDSSYGINTDQGKGTTGIIFYFGESPITWCTQKQPTMALSSCESEFMAATGAACQALWLKRLLSELTGWEEKRITLKVGNVSAIALVRNPVFHGRSKHIDIRYHF